MSLFIDNAIAGWIRNAEKNGELDSNPYKGKTIDLDEYFRTPAEQRMGMKILKDANCLPPAVEIMKQIEQKKDILKSTEDPEQQQVLQSDIRSLELKKALLLEHK
ncbi:putative cytoplasmic protein [Vibrio ishigakensis]|uniref:Putative cytoplasmic protein n=1 Tax=Vibrio ishigakensis TaxID=1481914 RepID=A0A0B8QNW7_9VIBR|nr:putative cytoplasmic protein [Vibrio ishigakensis]